MVLIEDSANHGGCHPPARTVFDIGDNELIVMAREMDETGLLLGTVAPVADSHSDWNANDLLQRSAAGARFLRLQPCSSLGQLRRHMARLVEEKVTWHFSVLPSLTPGKMGLGDGAKMIRAISDIPGVSGINLLCPEDPVAVTAALKESGIRPAS